MSGRGLTWYKRDPIRFLDGVQGMGPELIGAYAVILDLIYARDGEIRRDDRHLSGILGCSTRKAKALTETLIDAGKVEVRGDKLTQKVAETSVKQSRTERETRANAQRKRRENAAAANENNNIKDKLEGTKPPREEKIREDTIANAIDGEAVDATEVVWSKCKDWLVFQGVRDGQARSVIGKWLKDSSPAEVRAAFVEAFHAKTGDPIPYITRILSKPSTQPDLDALLADVSFGGHG